VLVDGDARVACVTPAARVDGRDVTTVEGLDPATRDRIAGAFVGTGGSQCGFCTPGIVMRAASLLAKGRARRADVDRGLAAHLCRCTGWQTVYEAIGRGGVWWYPGPTIRPRRRSPASRPGGGGRQRVGDRRPLGGGGFADDVAPRGASSPCPARRDDC
jgi:hypothetical protein